MKKAWNWLLARRKTLGKVGLAYVALELLLALAGVLGLKALL